MDRSLFVANTPFAIKLFTTLASRERGKNVFISPTSVALALVMAYNGARGQTQRAIAETLDLGDLSPDEINSSSAEMIRALHSLDPQITLAIANSLWVRQDVALRPEFVQRGRKYYAADVRALDFGDGAAAATINAWVQAQTNGKIEQIVDQIGGDALLFLINAIYFKGQWTRQFDRRLTREGPFTLLDGGKRECMIMSQSGKFSYYAGQGFQAVGLPYGSERLSMFLFLPATRSGLEAFAAELNARSWEAWMDSFRPTDGHIALPRFKLAYEATLNDALKALGMGVAFGPRADFGGMVEGNGPPVCIDEVKHKTFVEVNEQGTEAAAVTSVGMVRATFAPSRTFSMVVDRPFFCAIRDNQTGAILFMGAIVDPK
jgi:serine protease inhibitor